MILNQVVMNIQVVFLIFARVFAVAQVAPLLSSQSIPRIARVALCLMVSVLLLGWVEYPLPDSGLAYMLLVVGESMVGIIMGLYLVIIFSAFQTSGQFFSLQMGFGASQVFDPLAMIELPLMGQFFNHVAMLVFVAVGGFQKIFQIGIYRSFQAMRAVDLVGVQEDLASFLLSGLVRLFAQALVIALPVVGTLFLMSITMGLLAKAAPQMNLLMLGFPINIGVAFLMIFLAFPLIVHAFAAVIEGAFSNLGSMITVLWGGS